MSNEDIYRLINTCREISKAITKNEPIEPRAAEVCLKRIADEFEIIMHEYEEEKGRKMDAYDEIADWRRSVDGLSEQLSKSMKSFVRLSNAVAKLHEADTEIIKELCGYEQQSKG